MGTVIALAYFGIHRASDRTGRIAEARCHPLHPEARSL